MKYSNIRILFVLILWTISLTSYVCGQHSETQSEGEILFHKAVARIHELDTAIFYFQQAMPLLQQDASWDNYVNCMNALHFCYFEKDNYQKAEKYALDALEAAQNYLKTSAPPYSYALNNLGTIYTTKADYIKAIHYYEQALAIMKMNGKDGETLKAALADAYSNVGVLLFKTGQYETALAYFQECERLKKLTLPLGENDPFLAKTYRNIADAYNEIKNRKEGIFYLNKINKLLENPINKDQIQRLLRHYYFLVEFYMEEEFLDEKSIDKAVFYLEQIRFLDKDISYRPWQYYYLLAKLEIEKGETSKAKKSLEIALEKGTNVPPDEKALTLRLMGKAWFGEENFQTALAFYQRALNLLQDTHLEGVSPFPLLEIKTLKMKGKALHALSLWEDLVKNTEEASKKIISLRQNYRALGEKLQLAELSQEIHEQGIAAAFELQQQRQSRASIETAFSFSERTKSNILFESLMHSSATFQLPDSLRERENQLRIDIDFQEKLLFQLGKTSHPSYPNIKNRLFELRQNYQDLLTLLEANYPIYFDEKYNKALADLSILQKQLNQKDECLIFFWGKEHLYTFRIGQTKVSLNRISIKDSLENHIVQVRTQVSKPPSTSGDVASYLISAWELTKHLICENQKDLPENIQRLIIIPDGLLCYLPFEALLFQEPNLDNRLRYQELPYLVKRYNISYQYSASLWLRFQNEKTNKRDKELWAGYAPTYSPKQIASLQGERLDDSQVAMRDKMGFLPYAREEVEKIAELLGGTAFLDETASESQFKNKSKAFSILHLATHGLLEDKNPLYNQLLFSSMSDSLSEDGRLEAYELYNMKLNADLVVLSACNTGSGDFKKGEGVLSMSRAFSAAGCQSLLLSLWQVSDESTSKLMINFYKNLLAGNQKDLALQQAKKTYIETSEESLYAHPYFWAGFVVTGNMVPIDLPRSLTQIAWWLVLAFGGIAIGVLVRYVRIK